MLLREKTLMSSNHNPMSRMHERSTKNERVIPGLGQPLAFPFNNCQVENKVIYVAINFENKTCSLAGHNHTDIFEKFSFILERNISVGNLAKSTKLSFMNTSTSSSHVALQEIRLPTYH